MTEIRVTYSGLIALSISLINIITALAFLLIITRLLSPEELGTWRLLIGFTLQLQIIPSIVNYWVIRESAREIQSGKTAILSMGLLSTIGFIGYLFLAFFTGPQTDASLSILLFGSILIPVIFFESVLSAITLGWKPHASSIGSFVFSFAKIPLVVLFLYLFDLGVIGVISSVFLAHISHIVLLLYFSRKKITTRFDFNFLKTWIKRAWLPLYQQVGSFVFSLDVIIFSLMTGSVFGLAYFTAAWSVGNFTTNVKSFAVATYPKLLSENKSEFLQSTITRLIYFMIPVAGISITFAKPSLFALNPTYAIAAPAVIFVTIRVVFFVFNDTFSRFLMGKEQVDVQKRSNFKDYIKSRLFLVPTIHLIRFSIYIIGLFIMLLLLSTNYESIELVIFWSIIAASVEIPATMIFYSLVKKEFKIKLELSIITKYLLTGLMTFVPIFFLSNEFLIYRESIFEFLPNLLIFIFMSIMIYAIITYIIDARTRKLLNSIVRELKNKNYD